MDDARKVYTEPTKRIGPERKGFQNREYRAASDEGVRKFLQKANMKGYHRPGEKLTPARQKGLELTNKQMKGRITFFIAITPLNKLSLWSLGPLLD